MSWLPVWDRAKTLVADPYEGGWRDIINKENIRDAEYLNYADRLLYGEIEGGEC